MRTKYKDISTIIDENQGILWFVWLVVLLTYPKIALWILIGIIADLILFPKKG